MTKTAATNNTRLNETILIYATRYALGRQTSALESRTRPNQENP